MVLYRALNRSEETAARALCREIPLADGEVPEWIHLLPLGPLVQGRDGREWTMRDADAVVASTDLGGFVLDREHSTELKAPRGEESEAAGWVVDLQVEQGGEREPGIWGRIEWTPRGAEQVKTRSYRFISPVFMHTPEGVIVRLESAALTNRPNLDLAALNHRATEPAEEMAMNDEQRKALCTKLGLPEDATPEQINEKAGELALNARKASGNDFVPKAELETALNRAKAAEEKLKAEELKAFNARVEAALDKHQKAGKFPPASREFYKANCTTEQGLEALEAEMTKRPALVPTDDTSAEDTARNQRQGDPAQRALTDNERAICARMGVTEEEYRKELAREAEFKALKEG